MSHNAITRWSFTFQIQSREIDISTGRGKFLYIELADMNFDGSIDILCSINDVENGSVYVYQIPEDFR